MDKFFLTILNMSLTGAFVIAAIFLARLPLKKAPKIISYCLWAVAGFRLVFPLSIESMFSLIPFKAQVIPSDIAMQPIPRIDSGISFVNNSVSSILPPAAPAASVNPLQIWTAAGAFIWLICAFIMLGYGIVSFAVLKGKMRAAVSVGANIYEAENISSPFVLGIFKPGIYLPVGLSERERSYIILHEQTHIRRHDHIIKFAAYFILCLHWFNPLVWAAFLLMGVDMEMSCDERVLREMGGETKKDYSRLLLSLATKRTVSGSPLAFGEGGVKERIKNVLNFKKPSRVVVAAAVTLAAVLSVGFAVNRGSDAMNPVKGETYDFPDENYNRVFFQCNDTPYNPEYIVILAQLMNNQNVPELTCGEAFTLVKQVGHVWKVIPFAEGFGFRDMAFQIENGMSFDYSLEPEMFTEKLEEGNYRIVTEVWDTGKHMVWADFTIDKNAPKQETLDWSIPKEAPMEAYFLENPTEKERMTRLRFVKLYHDGTAWLGGSLISSYMLPKCSYSFEDDELLIYADLETEIQEKTAGVKNGSIIARFTVADDNTLIFQSANVPLFADKGARYVSESSADKITIQVWKDENGNTRYTLFDIVVTDDLTELPVGRVFDSIEGLNTALEEYRQDDMTVHVKHTFDFTKEEMQAIIEMFVIPSENYNISVGAVMPNEDFDFIETIEGNLDIIAENPAYASNVYAYITAHQTEYDEIVALGDNALQYMFAQFEKGGQYGLRGWIMAYACRDILGGDSVFTPKAAGSGQEWYDAYKLFIIDQQPQSFYDLTNSGKLIADAYKISSYELYTNSEKISVSVSGSVFSENAHITLYDTDGMNDIMVMQISADKKTGTFTNLTSAKNYCIVATGLDGCEIILSD
ncbi:beta-lactamase regulating signal transducer with metallopeptidase domain [Anaerotaenia torta]|uniref:M56 family metallopeptidase n=1 Tax=Anaerotaenia torta TaxID=433293 RepID=UPI003D21FBA6